MVANVATSEQTANMQGHIEKRGTKWRLTIDQGRDPLTGKRRRTSITAKTKAEAQARAREIVGTGRPATNARTVGQLLDAWLDQIDDRAPLTVKGYRSIADRYIRPAFGNLPVRDLTPERIDALYRRMKSQPGPRGWKLSVNTVRRTHAVLAGACAQAVRWRWLPENPCTGARPGRATRPDIEPPTIEEIERIVKASTTPLALAVRLALATGARRGELCGLQWADVDLDPNEGSVTIRRSIADVKGGTEVVTARRKSHIRTVSIDPTTVSMLAARRKEAAAKALELPGVSLAETGYVLAEDPGQVEPLRPGIITTRWRAAAARAGSTVRYHDIRHWSVTQLLAAGEPVNQVADRHGHRSGGAMTLNVYAHALTQLDRRAADVIGAAIDAR